jgi:DNA-binding transcriptional LysR family regulator
LRIGGRIALWEGILPQRVGWLRRTAADVAVRREIGFEDDLMRRLIEGTMDLAIMYTPTHSPGASRQHRLVGRSTYSVHNDGSCVLPLRLAAPLVETGRLYVVAASPQYLNPVYAVYARDGDNPVLALAVQGLREHAARYAG